MEDTASTFSELLGISLNLVTAVQTLLERATCKTVNILAVSLRHFEHEKLLRSRRNCFSFILSNLKVLALCQVFKKSLEINT
jgi:hypothetical protein